MFRLATVISDEARAKHHEFLRTNQRQRYQGLTFWSPNINLFRDPRWGRGQETYGEDPFLTGHLAVAFVRGLQGNDPNYFKVIATAKHFAVHSGPEGTRHTFNAEPSERDLLDTYLPAFKMAVIEGRADSVMCSYNRIDGVPACADADLLQKRLRGDWGFRGYVVSDCGAIDDIFKTHKYKATAAEASAAAVKAGTDLTCGGEYKSLTQAAKDGLITEAEIDRSLARLFEARFRLGMFDPPERVPFAAIPYSAVDSAEHRALALEAARKSIVLLKNTNGVLPLAPSTRMIAVIGPSADDADAPLGNYNGIPSKLVTPLAGIERQFAGKAEVRYALGATYTAQSPAPLPRAVLTPPDGKGHGVLAEYFEDASFKGSPSLQRVEPRPVRTALADGEVGAAFGSKPFSVRWTGTLRAPYTGEYTIAPGGAGRSPMRVFLDEEPLVEKREEGRTAPARVTLKKGQAYRFRAEFPASTGRVGGERGNTQVMWTPPAEPLLNEAVDAVRASEVAIAFVGLNPALEGEEMPVAIPGFSSGDRTSIDLPAPQATLIEAAIATGKPVIVVLTAGSAVAINVAAGRAAAVLDAWYGGEEIGTAIADTLAGANNPAGRLPVTFYKSTDQLPPFDDYAMKGRTYRYFEGEALYGFGFGLSYSKFQYSDLRTQRTAAGAIITARVQNVSSRDGDEVVQLYVKGGGGPGDPLRQLRGFQRLHLKPGEARETSFTLSADDVPKARAHVSVGGGQPIGTIARVEGDF
jgi:beta-glucosidase